MKKIFFFYPRNKTLTGQEQASKLILSCINDYNFSTFYFPAFEKTNRNLFYLPFYFIKVLCSWGRIFSIVFRRKPLIYVNLSQTYMSLLRDGLPFKALSFFKSYSMVISLHGHVFTTWRGDEKVCKLFVSIIKRAAVITVLGNVQKQKLMSLGLPESKIKIVPNTCDLEAQSYIKKPGSLKLLYLSNLIETKGYMEFLETLQILSKGALGQRIDAVLCGKFYSEKDDKTVFVEKLIKEINTSKTVRVSWEKGAYGNNKERLYRDCDIFIFPSKYKVEAQPIVLIEAMASSCAIITTKVGEIPSTVSETCAILLDRPNPDEISRYILQLIKDDLFLKAMQLESSERFKKHFSLDIYKENWQSIFTGLNK